MTLSLTRIQFYEANENRKIMRTSFDREICVSLWQHYKAMQGKNKKALVLKKKD